MKALAIMTFLLFVSIFAEGAPSIVYRPAQRWGFHEAKVLQRMDLTDEQAERARRQGFIVEADQPVFLLQSDARIQRVFLESGDGGNTAEPPVWAFAPLRLTETHQLPNGRGEGVNICVLDSGVNHQHPALQGALREGRNFTDSRAAKDISDASGHGTAIATLIAGRPVDGRMMGVAPAASLSMAKVIPASGTGSLAVLAEGFRWCLDRAQVINLSVGFQQESQVMKDLMQEAYRRKISVVVAAGNDPRGVLPSAREKTAIAVGSVNSKLQTSAFSARGPELDFLAPGEGIAVWDAKGQVSVKSGTSLSAAMMSGVEAIRRSRGAPKLKTRSANSPLERGFGVIDAFATATQRP